MTGIEDFSSSWINLKINHTQIPVLGDIFVKELIGLMYLIVGLALIAGMIIGFVIFLLRFNMRPSGILHIKETPDKDYYTIEITDDLDEIIEKKAIVLLIRTSRDMHSL